MLEKRTPLGADVRSVQTETWEARALLNYWDEIRGSRLIPHRRDFNPGAIRRLLPFLSVAEVRGPRDVRLRLVGTAHRDRLGRETTGCDALEELPEIHRETRAYMTWQIVTWPCGYYGRGLMDALSANVPHELVMLPMAPAAETESMILLLSIMVPLHGRRWRDIEDPMKENVASECFFDIGAGLPPIAPSDGWDQVSLPAKPSAR